MDYGVKYNIAVNGNTAAAELSKFANAASIAIPKINKNFDSLNAKINTTLKRLANLKRELSLINKTKLSINTGGAIRDLSTIQRRLDRIKSKTINVNVNERGRGVGSRIGRSAAGGRDFLSKSFNTTSMMSAGGIPFATTLGAGLIGLGLRSVIGDAIEFQNTMLSAMNVLKADDADLTTFSGRFDTLSKNMRQLGVDTKFTAVDIAGAVKLLAMAGMNLETVDTSMKAITNLATIGDSDLPKMADIMTNIMNGYGIAAKEMNKAADIMAVVSNQTNVDVVDIGESMNYAASYMRMASVDFNEGAAAIGLLGNAGIKASRAGTSMRAMLIRMISPTTKAQKVIDRLGVSFTKMTTVDGKQKEVLRPLYEIFTDLKKSGATMEDLVQIFDKIGGGAALALTDNAEKLKQFTDNTKNAGGIADFLAEEKMKTVLGLSQQLKSKFMDLGQTMFNKLSPQIENMMQELLGWLKSDEAAKAFENITNGIGSMLGGMRDLAIFVNQNWGWLKFIFGGLVVGKIGSGIGSMLGGVLGQIRGLISGASTLGSVLLNPVSSMKTLITGGTAAAGAVGGLGATLASFAVGGVVVGGLAAIGYQLFKIYETGKKFDELKDTLSDWSMKTTGMNLESIDILQQKLNDIRYTGQMINIEKSKFGQGIGDQAWISGVETYNKQTGNWFTKITGLGQHKTNQGLWDIAAQAAYGGKEAIAANELFLTAIAGSPADRAKALSSLGMMSLAKIPSQTEDRLYSHMATGTKLPTNPGAMENILTGSAPYISNVRKISAVKKQQAERFLSEMAKGGEAGGMGALNALLGGEVDIPSIFTTIKGRKTTSPEDLQAILRAKGTSVAAIKSSLQTKGVPTAMIDSLMTMAGFGKLISTGISTGTSIQKMTTQGEDEESLSGASYSGTGKMSNTRTGKMIVVNIDSLFRVDKATFAKEEDIEAMKEKMASALMDVVKDFEIGYN